MKSNWREVALPDAPPLQVVIPLDGHLRLDEVESDIRALLARKWPFVVTLGGEPVKVRLMGAHLWFAYDR